MPKRDPENTKLWLPNSCGCYLEPPEFSLHGWHQRVIDQAAIENEGIPPSYLGVEEAVELCPIIAAENKRRAEEAKREKEQKRRGGVRL